MTNKNPLRGTIASIAAWFTNAKPSKTENDVQVQIGVHFEEVGEMLAEMATTDGETEKYIIDALQAIKTLAKHFKSPIDRGLVISDDIGFLDSLCDQIVTATGVGELKGYMIDLAVEEVDKSNWSKFVDGKAILDENGKIAKGPGYFRADLEPFI